MDNHIVIMAGGIGSRFWPMSTPEFTKQFIDVLGIGRTLIQMTFDRFLPICRPENMWVVTSAHYVDIVKQQLPQIPSENILAEPAARNTAPCIAYACWKIRRRLELEGGDADANIVVTPSDALVLNPEQYRRVISSALDFTAGSSAIVTVGITPTRPETGYGYIHARSNQGEGIIKVQEFKEKPDLATAVSYLEDGNYLWNAGIFVWKLSTIVSSLRRFAPSVAEVMDEIAEAFYTDDESRVIETLFPTCEKISIDYAVMEKSPDIYTIPGNFGWSDLGTWGSLRQNSAKDADGNAIVGPSVEQHECSGCVVHVSDLKHVVIEGLHDYIVAEKDGRLLICRLSSEQRIKEFQK